eukprot:4698608-Pyramimonas_sp.AAC.1
MAHHECEACLGHRGLIPSGWTAVAPTTDTVSWNTVGFNGPIEPGCLGCGSIGDPILICADAAGGPDSRDPRFRRVGIAIIRV